jgi:hypothetical protein
VFELARSAISQATGVARLVQQAENYGSISQDIFEDECSGGRWRAFAITQNMG